MPDSRNSAAEDEKTTAAEKPVEPEVKEARRKHGDPLDPKVAGTGQDSADRQDG